MTSDLMPSKVQLTLVTWSLDVDKNFFKLLVPIGIIICLYEGPLVVILNHGLGMLELFTILWISSIFLSESLGKFFLSLRMFQILEDKTCVYEHTGEFGLLVDLLLLDFSLDFCLFFFYS